MSNKRKHENQLQAVFNFTDEDVQYNRELELSPAQAQMNLVNIAFARSFQHPTPLQAVVFMALLLPLIGISMAAMMNVEAMVNADLKIIWILPLIIIFLLVWLQVALLRTACLVFFSDLRAAFQSQPPDLHLQFIEGAIGVYRLQRGKAYTHHARIRNKEFNLTQKQYMALHHGEVYRFYYSPVLWDRILSVEKIESA